MIKHRKINIEDVKSKICDLNTIYEKYSHILVCMYVFGSINSCRSTPLSDIDIAILFDNSIDEKQMDLYENKILSDLSDFFNTEEIDLIVLNKAPLSIQYGVIKSKSNMYYKDLVKIADYENNIVLRYIDFKKYRDELNDAFIKSLIKRR
mgnify:CR=1 FL=1